ncbi:MAG: amidohydrolase [Chloroflexi bacterium]|nr:amidohydrolase [Chloroflexota bacterium]
MIVTDAQVHLWEAHRPDRPWPSPVSPPPWPHRPEPLGGEEMLQLMREAGVGRAVIVPPSWAGDHNDTALEIVVAHPTHFAIMGRFEPRAPGALDRLPTWLDQPGMLGIRLSLHHGPSRVWLDGGTLEHFWPAAERFGIPLMVYVPGLCRLIAPIAERHPDLRLVIDHLARPIRTKDAPAWADLDEVLALARFPNVTVKVSSLPTYTSESYPFPSLDAPIRRVYDHFGPQRMMWGSDLTKLPCSYRECLDHFRVALDFLSESDREWILGRTAATVLRWPEPS